MLKEYSKALKNMLRSGKINDELLNKLPKNDLLKLIISEFKNLHRILSNIKPKPGSIPETEGFDIYGSSKPFNNISGGDHIIYIDFKKRFNLEKRLEKYGKEKIMENKKKSGILIADVSGHDFTDGVLASQFHQAFLLGVQYELREYGEITTNLFEELNTRFARSSRLNELKKYITAIYGELSEDGNFKYISAGHPIPIVFSNEYDQIVDIGKENRKTGAPIGFMPSKEHIDSDRTGSNHFKENYTVNTIKLFSPGDILIMYTDGLSDIFNDSGVPYFDPDLKNTPLENKLKEIKNLSSKSIHHRIYRDILRFQPNLPDDLTYLIIKK